MIKTLLAAAAAILLTACGGGDPDPEDGKVPPPGPVNCEIRPELCK